MSGNAQSKFVNEYNSEEDYCGVITHKCDLNAYLKADHTVSLAEKKEELLMDAIEVWKYINNVNSSQSQLE